MCAYRLIADSKCPDCPLSLERPDPVDWHEVADSVSRTAGLVLRDHRDRSNPMDLLKVPGPIDIAGTCQSMYVQLYQYQLSQRFYNLCRYPAQHLCCLMSCRTGCCCATASTAPAFPTSPRASRSRSARWRSASTSAPKIPTTFY
jgi:hypothetical protein